MMVTLSSVDCRRKRLLGLRDWSDAERFNFRGVGGGVSGKLGDVTRTVLPVKEINHIL